MKRGGRMEWEVKKEVDENVEKRDWVERVSVVGDIGRERTNGGEKAGNLSTL